jgi:hypothetical protein
MDAINEETTLFSKGAGKTIKTILTATLLAGTLDALAAVFILAGGNAAGVFRYIATGLFGAKAFSGDSRMIVYGLLFHFVITFIFALYYFWMYLQFSFLRINLWLSSVFYGLLIWLIMNRVVVPLSHINKGAISLPDALLNMTILTVCIGLPVCYLAKRFYKAE